MLDRPRMKPYKFKNKFSKRPFGPNMRQHRSLEPGIGPPGPGMRLFRHHMRPQPGRGPPGSYMRLFRRHMRFQPGIGPPEPHRCLVIPPRDMGPPGPDMRPPGPDMGPLGPDMGPPGPGMGPYRYRMGPGPYMRPPGPDMGPPGPDMGPPGPVMGPLGPDMGPPGPGMGPYRYRMGPGPGMGPYGYHMGSRPDMGPKPDIRPPGTGPPGPGVGPPGPSMWPPGQNMGIPGMSRSDIVNPGIPPLPPQVMAPSDWTQWREYTDPLGRAYYYNICTQESVWDKPQVLLDFDEKLRMAEVSQAQTSVQKNASADTEDISDESEEEVVEAPPEWTQWREYKNIVGRTYYYNICTKESVWDNKPQVLLDFEEKLRMAGVSQAQTSVQKNASADTEDITDESEEEEVVEAPPEWTQWREYKNIEGRTYYYNICTKESVWDNKPQVLLDFEEKLRMAGVSQAQTSEQQNASADTEDITDESEEEVVEESKEQPEAIEEKKPEQTPEPKAEPKPVNKSRPVARIAIPGTVWYLVRTSDGRCFFYDPSKRHSSWVRPEELKNRPDVDKLLSLDIDKVLSHKPEVKTEDKEEKDVQEEPPSKKMRSEPEVKEAKKDNNSEFSQQTVLGMETQVAQHGSVVSMEVKMKLFKELLADKNVSAHARWEEELHKIASDKRYSLLTSRERRQVFDEYVKDKEDNENNKEINEKKELYRQLLEESNLNEKSEAEVKEVKKASKNEAAQQIGLGKETAIEAEVEAAQQRSIVSTEAKMEQFKELLAEKNVSANSTWEKESVKVVFDKRYFLLTLQERKQVFEEYVKDRTEKERSEKNSKVKKTTELHKQLLEDNNLNGKAETKMKVEKEDSNNEVAQQIVLGKQAAIEAEIEAAKQRSVVSMEDRMKQFKELLAEKDVSAHSTWEKELHKIVFDKRYLLLTSKERRQAFEEYVRKKTEQDKNKTINEKKELYRKFLEDSVLNGKAEAEMKEVKEESKNEVGQQIYFGKEAAVEAVVAAAKQRSAVSVNVRIKQFKEMLAEKDVSAHSTWEKELHKIVFDKRYLLLNSLQRKQTFKEYVRNKAEQEKYKTISEQKELYRQLLKDSNLNGKSTFHNFTIRYSRDKRFSMIDNMRDRKAMFLSYIRELTKQEKLNNALIKKKLKNDFIQMVSEIPGINPSTTLSDVRSKVSSDPRYEAAVTDSRREDWFREYLKTLNNATSDDIGTKGEQEKKPHSSSIKEKSESKQSHREEVIVDFKQFLAEKVTHSEDSYGGFKSSFHANPIWKVALPLIDTEKLYCSHVDEVHKKNRAILWSILDGIDLLLTTVWDAVKEKVQADPRFLNYTDSEKKREKEYAVYMRKKFLKAKEDFQELLKETKLITPETKTKLQQGSITLKAIECLIQNDKRYTAIACINKQREQMLQAYINELSEKNQPSHSLSPAAAPVTG